MTEKIEIGLRAQVREAQNYNSYLQNRNLVLSQTIDEMEAAVISAQSDVGDLNRRIESLVKANADWENRVGELERAAMVSARIANAPDDVDVSVSLRPTRRRARFEQAGAVKK